MIGSLAVQDSHSIFSDVEGGQYSTVYFNSLPEGNDKILGTLRAVGRGWGAPECMKGTRRAILEDINNWLDKDATPNILWLCGPAGTGKSTIASTLTSQLTMQGRLASSFFFERNDARLSDPAAVWRTVASDLARFDSDLRASLVEVLRKTRVDPGNADIELHFKRMIEEPLTENFKKLSERHPVVVLDALDECGLSASQAAQRTIFLDTLTGWCRLPSGLKLIVTGRDELVPKSFHDGHLFRRIVLPHAEDISSDPEVSNDIRLFLMTRLTDIQTRFPSLSPAWPGNAIIEQLTTHAAGLFIWASTLVKFIEDEESIPSAKLDLILGGKFREGARNMDALYSQILANSFGRSKDTLRIFRAVVGAIVLAKTPIHRGDLAYFLSRREDETQIDLVLNKLASVISVGKLDKRLKICHLSFSEYLCDRRRCLDGFEIDRSAQSGQLVLACLRLMKDGLRFNICSLKTSHLRNDDVVDLADRIQRSIPSHLSYACRFWAHHLRDTDKKEHDHDGLLNAIHNFLYTRLLYWLEVMSLIQEIPMAIAALLAAAQWIGVSFMQCMITLRPSNFDLFLLC